MHFAAIAVVLITGGLLTNVFDGIVARQLNVSAVKLRRLDSTVNQHALLLRHKLFNG